VKKILANLFRFRYRYSAAIMVIAGGLYFLMPSHGDGKITKANFDITKHGMTQAEVEAILGPGAEKSGYYEIRGVPWRSIVSDAGAAPTVYWDGDEGTIRVLFIQGNRHNSPRPWLPSKSENSSKAFRQHRQQWTPSHLLGSHRRQKIGKNHTKNNEPPIFIQLND
jgi:hypothetical protein